MYKHIIAAVDDSATSNRALQEAIGLARDQHAALRIVYVMDEAALVGAALVADPGVSGKTWREIGDEILKRAQDAARAGGVEAAVQLLQTEDVEDRVAQAIIKDAKSWGADVLVAGTHGRGGLKHLLMGSVAEGIIRHTLIPVLLVRQTLA
jgi:nucleotide-binding universal stress UspA family protein